MFFHTLNFFCLFHQDFNITPYRTFLKATPEGKPYGIYDNLVSAKDQLLLKELLTFDVKDWLFNNYDSEDDNEQVCLFIINHLTFSFLSFHLLKSAISSFI